MNTSAPVCNTNHI